MDNATQAFMSTATQQTRLLLDETNAATAIDPYTSVGFIIWYCLIFACCALPIVCIAGVYCGKCHVRMNASDENESDDDGDSIDNDILRMEANIQAFSQQQANRRKITLVKALDPGTSIITSADLEVPENDSQDEFHKQLQSECSICLAKYQGGDRVVQSPIKACNHVFHQECLVTWLSSRQTPQCPCCRQRYVDGFSNLLPKHQNNEGGHNNEVMEITGQLSEEEEVSAPESEDSPSTRPPEVEP